MCCDSVERLYSTRCARASWPLASGNCDCYTTHAGSQLSKYTPYSQVEPLCIDFLTSWFHFEIMRKAEEDLALKRSCAPSLNVKRFTIDFAFAFGVGQGPCLVETCYIHDITQEVGERRRSKTIYFLRRLLRIAALTALFILYLHTKQGQA